MKYRNILIVKLSAIGDVIHALPVASALKQQFPEARITWVVEKPAYDILNNNPYIDEIIIFDKANFKTVAGFIKHAPTFITLLRQHHFDLVLDLQGLFKSAAIAFLSGAPKRLVYCNARELSHLVGEQICGPHQNGHVVDRYLDVVRALGCAADDPEFAINITAQEAELAVTKLKQAGMDINKQYIVLIPGTNWPNKRWPTKHFSQLADKLYDENIIPVIVGSPADTVLARDITAKTNIPPVDLTGKTSLKELSYILKNAQKVVAGDTGPMHLAAALQTPVIGLFGPTDPKRNGPYGTGNLVLTTNRSCQGCWQRQCPEGRDCLDNIGANEVFEAVMSSV